MKIRSVLLDNITLGERHRRDLGDLVKLSESLDRVGLLQAIGVDAGYTLVFGERRLAAARLLGWEKIDCHILDIESILLGEHAENEFRKNFTPSERAAIARAVEAELGNRAGRPSKEKVANVPQLAGEKTRSIAADKAGFTSEQQYRRAKTVVEMGAPETIAAMDSGEVSIAAAETIAKMPREQQAEVVTMPRPERRAAVKSAREKEELERRDREVVVVRSFEAWVKDVGDFPMEAKEFWEAAARHLVIGFEDKIERASNCLSRIKEGHPNETKRPRAVR